MFIRILRPSRKILVVAPGREEVEPVGLDAVHERVAAPGEHDYPVLGVFTDAVEQVGELFVSVAVEHQLPAVGVEHHFQHAGVRPRELRIGIAPSVLD